MGPIGPLKIIKGLEFFFATLSPEYLYLQSGWQCGVFAAVSAPASQKRVISRTFPHYVYYILWLPTEHAPAPSFENPKSARVVPSSAVVHPDNIFRAQTIIIVVVIITLFTTETPRSRGLNTFRPRTTSERKQRNNSRFIRIQ